MLKHASKKESECERERARESGSRSGLTDNQYHPLMKRSEMQQLTLMLIPPPPHGRLAY